MTFFVVVVVVVPPCVLSCCSSIENIYENWDDDRSREQAIGHLQSLMKLLYKRMFQVIVSRVNGSIRGTSGDSKACSPQSRKASPQSERRRSLEEDGRVVPRNSNGKPTSPRMETGKLSNHIGILDIYGFEQFEVNSFEQLCINLANEHLQQLFVENVLRAEQDIYTREGLAWTNIPIPDSAECIGAIEQSMAILDDHCHRITKQQKTTDKKYVNSMILCI
jgi:myosin heavy subunit